MTQSSAQQMRDWKGPALFSFGFRPFFLGGASWVAFAMLIWIATLSGQLTIPTRFDPVSWHAHEFLFGYLGAVIAGFLLTAVPNWTGRLPVVGWRLATLFALWALGRVAVFFSAILPPGTAVAVDLAFPIALAVLILNEIIAGKNWRNLLVLALLSMFILSNAVFHAEVLTEGYAAQGYGLRLGVATAIMMISVIGGRIIPSFTRNWLARTNNPARPAPPMQVFDKAVLAASIAILSSWVLLPGHSATGVLLLALGLLHLGRLFRWQGHHTGFEPLVWVLHVSYGFIPLGAFLMGIGILIDGTDIPAIQHLWMAGAIGAMTLAVMTRATLGHSGRELVADKPTLLIYLCLFTSVGVRVISAFCPQLITVSGVLWLAGFAGFVFAYAPLLLRPK